ncbi:MAG TPA: hypothetical protein VD833_15330 [Vicinamibacterales bacterium]|nr:hypothetical protein [Vicinamibacterales bacterium]
MLSSNPGRRRVPGGLPALVAALTLACALAAIPAAAGGQDQKVRTPKKGDHVRVKGCLQGLVLTATETSLTAEEDPTGALYTPFTYQLKGDKDLLKRLRAAYDDRIVEVQGELKSTLPQPEAEQGLRIGKTRIFVGGGNAADPMVRQGGQPLPVLEVDSFEGTAVTCGH